MTSRRGGNKMAAFYSASSSSNAVNTTPFLRRSFSAHSSFAEPSSLFTASDETSVSGSIPNPFSSPTTTTAGAASDKNVPLRNDVRTMGSLLGHIIQEHHGMETFEKIEELRALAKKWRELGAGRNVDTAEEADRVFQELAGICSGLSNEEILIISRAFTHFLAIANAAEGHHRVRLLNQSIKGEALADRYDSWYVWFVSVCISLFFLNFAYYVCWWGLDG